MSSAIPRIQSRQNRRFQLWRTHAACPEEASCPWIPVEGWKSIQDLTSDRVPELLLFSDTEESRVGPLAHVSTESFCLTGSLMKQLSTLDSPTGVLAFFRKPCWDWEDLTPWVLYLDRLQDPGNLGTLLRSSAASGIFSLVTSPRSVSCFNNKVTRASSGALFSVPFLQGVAVEELRERGYHLWAARPQAGRSLFEVHFEAPLAILIGNEGAGLSPECLAAADDALHIPVHAGDSLNAAVAGSLILYEVVRQRMGHG